MTKPCWNQTYQRQSSIHHCNYNTHLRQLHKTTPVRGGKYTRWTLQITTRHGSRQLQQYLRQWTGLKRWPNIVLRCWLNRNSYTSKLPPHPSTLDKLAAQSYNIKHSLKYKKPKPSNYARGRVSQLQNMFRKYFDMSRLQNAKHHIKQQEPLPKSGSHPGNQSAVAIEHTRKHEQKARKTGPSSQRPTKNHQQRHQKISTEGHARVQNIARNTACRDLDDLEDDLLDWASNLDKDE